MTIFRFFSFVGRIEKQIVFFLFFINVAQNQETSIGHTKARYSLFQTLIRLKIQNSSKDFRFEKIGSFYYVCFPRNLFL